MKCAKHAGGCATCENRKNTEWRDLDEASLALLESKMISHEYAPGEVIYHQGDDVEGVYCIQQGLIGERHLNAEGDSVLVHLRHAGTTIGYQEFLTHTPYNNSAEVLQPTIACFINKNTVSDLLEHNPSVGHRFLQTSLRDAHEMEDAYVAAMTTNVQKRLLHLLLVLYERYGKRQPDGRYTFKIPIAKKDLAELVGTAPESISRAIKKLNSGNLMHIKGSMVEFDNLQAIYNEIEN